MNERRKNKRIKLNEKITLSINSLEIKGSQTSDISVAGMCILFDSKIELKKNDKGRILLTQRYGKEVISFESDILVLWNNELTGKQTHYRIGIRFLNLDPINFENLCSILSYQENNIIVKV